jgi:hypothetical protein
VNLRHTQVETILRATTKAYDECAFRVALAVLKLALLSHEVLNGALHDRHEPFSPPANRRSIRPALGGI